MVQFKLINNLPETDLYDWIVGTESVFHTAQIHQIAESFSLKYRQLFNWFAFSILTEAPPSLTAPPIPKYEPAHNRL